jgi:hypothetical protein
MKFKFTIFFIIIIFAKGFAQETGTIPSTSFPRLETKIPEKEEAKPQYSISKPFEITKFKKPEKVYESPKLEPNKTLNQPKSDIDYNKIYGDKLNKKEGSGKENSDSKLYRRNMFLGDYKLKAESVGIFYRDFGLVDGDLIRVLINDKVVVYEIFLNDNFQQLDIKLEKGINKIDFEALNQGTSGPNTAEFKIFDDKKNLVSENQWNLGTGFKATVIIVKE